MIFSLRIILINDYNLTWNSITTGGCSFSEGRGKKIQCQAFTLRYKLNLEKNNTQKKSAIGKIWILKNVQWRQI